MMTSSIVYLVLDSEKIAAAPSWTNQFRTQINMETGYLQTTGRDLTSRTSNWSQVHILDCRASWWPALAIQPKPGDENGDSSARFFEIFMPGSGRKTLILFELSMADRRSYQYSSMHWTNISAPYPPATNYSPVEYQGIAPSASAQTMGQIYDGEIHSSTRGEGYSSSYYSNSNNHTNALTAGYHAYSSTPSHASEDNATLHGQRHTHHPSVHQPQSTRSYPTTYGRSASQSYAYSQYSSLEGRTQERSYSQIQDAYISQPSSPTSYQTSPQYPPQIPLTPAPTSPSQYSASPSRPFSCDLCTLSFNRQHDLKRHRETHSGEKPYFCNGGCGKTFTRKDALKRHQVRGITHSVSNRWYTCQACQGMRQAGGAMVFMNYSIDHLKFG